MSGLDQETINTFIQLREKVFAAYRAKSKVRVCWPRACALRDHREPALV